jgi:hypothetical protein
MSKNFPSCSQGRCKILPLHLLLFYCQIIPFKQKMIERMRDRCKGGVLVERNKANMDEESWLWIQAHHHPPVTHTGDTSLGNRGTPNAEVENAMKKISSCAIWQIFWRPTVCCRHLISLIMFDCKSENYENREHDELTFGWPVATARPLVKHMCYIHDFINSWLMKISYI